MRPEEISENSTIGEIFASPVGHDVFSLLLSYLGKDETLINNPLVSRIKLKHAKKLSMGLLDDDFCAALVGMINLEKDRLGKSGLPAEHAWWKEAVFYQIYPRSFCDSNGDGIGDLRGIISKLDYLRELGVDALWLSPVYDSPNDDNGYDIRDYEKIMSEFGTMEDFDELLEAVHSRGMRLIMDLVVNHTSDEHEWFKKALEDPKSKYRGYYFFRNNGSNETPPNNWKSFFSGSAWNSLGGGEWVLHLFSKKQMDLNWENPELRADIIAMINRWLDKGVDGFRMDVINYISKADGLPDGYPKIGALTGFTGAEQYFYGPHLHDYLREINQKAFAKHKAFAVGETPGIGMEMARLLIDERRGELNTVFNFDHLENPGHTRMEDYSYDLNCYRDYIVKWQTGLGTSCRMSLFFNNHDNPRMISKITKDVSKHPAIAKLLAVMQFTLCGTVFMFQGDEMGLANYDFKSIEQISDVEARNYYAEHCQSEDPQKVFERILAGTREHTRVLLPWNSTRPPFHEGLDQPVKEDVREVYRQLIAFRRGSDAILYGDFKPLRTEKNSFTYSRSLYGETVLVDLCLADTEIKAYPVSEGFEPVYPAEIKNSKTLSPYEARIYRKKK